jgi:hypothetical protein
MKRRVYALALAVALSGGASVAVGDESWPGFEPFTLNDLSLVGRVSVDAPCMEAWKVLTEIDRMRTLAPHLGLHSATGQRTAEQRGDAVRVKVQKAHGIMTGEFVLTTPVPFHKITAVLIPDNGPWMRIQQWTLNNQTGGKCVVDYNEAYNELWVKTVGIDKSGFIKKNRDHHMHVVLRRIKNLAEGKEPGPAEETAYLFEDAKVFPDKFRAIN